MKLGIPYVEQPFESDLCGPACAAMVLQYHGSAMSLAATTDDLYLGGARGVTFTKMASYFLAHDLNVTVQAWPDGMTEELRSDTVLMGGDALEALRQGESKGSTSKARMFSGELRAFINRGGGVLLRPVTLDDYRHSLEGGSPVIVGLDRKPLEGLSRRTLHYVVINGATSSDSQVTQPYVDVHDPLWGPDGFTPADDVLDACTSWLGLVIYVNKQ